MLFTKDRHITHMDLDTFYVSVECLRNSKLLGKPVLIGGMSDRGVVASCSNVATNEIKPNGQIEIPFGNEKTFLAPLSIMKIPGIGKETGYKLLKMGVETVKTLSEIPVTLMYNLLGKNGNELHRRANGIDESPVVPYREKQSISTEQTFESDTIDTTFLYKQLVRMTEKIAFELRSKNKLTGCISVKIR